ncbi:MAG: class I SAM-dependent methyltransferase [Intestinibacter sp.]|uniref:class I SAM-dependent methyltransferase n=1 Tax=Intestinibacter sp. TaxID=1965304 RepID=UPI003F162E3C
MNYLEEIKDYWSTQTENFYNISKNELETEIYDIWRDILEKNIPKDKNLLALDVGCGSGFFSVLLAQLGYKVMAVDYNENMIKRAKKLVSEYNLSQNVTFKKMDAQNLEFKDCSFDIVISRNITWILENPSKAYSEWLRVLKSGGKLLNFDANWYLHYYDEEARRNFEKGLDNLETHGYISNEVKERQKQSPINQIIYELPLSKQKRPAWDVDVLTKLDDCKKITIIPDLPNEIWDDYYRLMYKYIATFMVLAEKK